MPRLLLPVIAFLLCLTILVAPVAAQQRANEQLILSVERELPLYVDDVDVRSLSVGQVSALHLAIHSSRSHSEIRGQVLSILGGLDVLLFGRNLTFP